MWRGVREAIIPLEAATRFWLNEAGANGTWGDRPADGHRLLSRKLTIVANQTAGLSAKLVPIPIPD
jgi:hypothetical protein